MDRKLFLKLTGSIVILLVITQLLGCSPSRSSDESTVPDEVESQVSKSEQNSIYGIWGAEGGGDNSYTFEFYKDGTLIISDNSPDSQQFLPFSYSMNGSNNISLNAIPRDSSPDFPATITYLTDETLKVAPSESDSYLLHKLNDVLDQPNGDLNENIIGVWKIANEDSLVYFYENGVFVSKILDDGVVNIGLDGSASISVGNYKFLSDSDVSIIIEGSYYHFNLIIPSTDTAMLVPINEDGTFYILKIKKIASEGITSKSLKDGIEGKWQMDLGGGNSGEIEFLSDNTVIARQDGDLLGTGNYKILDAGHVNITLQGETVNLDASIISDGSSEYFVTVDPTGSSGEVYLFQRMP